MKLITSSSEYREVFSSLLQKYSEYYFATAWAGMPDGIIGLLDQNRSKIRQYAVGVDFCHTDPQFLENFRTKIKVSQAPDGTFHPKIFLFFNGENDWALITGSNNFTTGAFYKNIEAAMLIYSRDNTPPSLLSETRQFISSCYNAGKAITKAEIAGYKLKWARAKRRQKQDSVINENVFTATDTMNLTWRDYVAEYGKGEGVKLKIEMLSQIKSIFALKQSLRKMDEQERRLVGGLKTSLNRNWADFGTNGNGIFKQKIINGDKHFSEALDLIPLAGEVTKEHYNGFLNMFLQSENVTNTWISSAGRLLAMKRPDTFYSLTGTNKAGFCTAFGIDYAKVTLETYWDLVVERITLSRWWNAEIPRDRYQRSLWDARAAMLDVLYYEEF